MDKVISAVEKILKEKSNAVIGIDGPCASGKTTLAQILAERFDAQVIHTDDFFLPVGMRTEERLRQPGGNVHYERFANEVVKGIESGREFTCNAYSCSYGTFTEKTVIRPDKPIIVEGSYSLHPEIRRVYDFTVFVEADYDVRLERIRRRNGAEALEVFRQKWIPLEDNYFDKLEIRKICNIITKTDR